MKRAYHRDGCKVLGDRDGNRLTALAFVQWAALLWYGGGSCHRVLVLSVVKKKK